ncbi:MAG: hypothetical protein EPO24_15930 [Bacteroidetes bacterium]|nr:MAG: hypothetical protein EPO24_15930 [Bacteroidota bacterium]
MKLSELLYTTIKNFELERRIELDDSTFDAFTFLAAKIGHKNPSTLRKMCESRPAGSNAAKLGVEEAIIIMSATHDYRLFRFIEEQLKLKQLQSKTTQLNIFSQPMRVLGGGR